MEFPPTPAEKERGETPVRPYIDQWSAFTFLSLHGELQCRMKLFLPSYSSSFLAKRLFTWGIIWGSRQKSAILVKLIAQIDMWNGDNQLSGLGDFVRLTEVSFFLVADFSVGLTQMHREFCRKALFEKESTSTFNTNNFVGLDVDCFSLELVRLLEKMPWLWVGQENLIVQDSTGMVVEQSGGKRKWDQSFCKGEARLKNTEARASPTCQPM